MALGRREFMGSVGAGAVTGLLTTGCSSDVADPSALPQGSAVASVPVSGAVFAHGVASGDPLQASVLLWTRVTVEGDSPVQVRWVMATDPELSEIVQEGVAAAEAERDYTVQVDVQGLEPGTTYYYAFARSRQARSATGRTRTLPQEGVTHLRLAFTSCSNFNNGYFNAYGAIAQRADLDVWIHLGDYIYEYADGEYGDTSLTDRAYDPPGETVTLEAYRARHAQYRTDPELQEIHRQHPIIVVWDDHETANDGSVEGAENHQPDEGDWDDRKRAGTRAFLEWLPVRAVPADPVPKIFRSFQFGDLLDLMMLDTRLWGRDMQTGYGEEKGDPEVWTQPDRTLLGDDQEAWLLSELSTSRERGTTWRFLGNQIIFSPTRDPRDGLITFADFWDGYQAQRQRVIDHILSDGITNLVILTGDIHTSWAMDVAADPFDPERYDPETGEGAFAVEFVGPSVTSQGLEGDPTAPFVVGLLQSGNPHLKYSEVTRKGYVLVDIKPERVQAEWYHMKDFKQPGDLEEELAVAFVCEEGLPHLLPAAGASAPRANAAPLAPGGVLSREALARAS